MAGNEEHPFASIVAAYHESQAPALDTDEVPAESAPAETTTAAAHVAEEPVVAEPVAEDLAPAEEPVLEPAAEVVPAEEPVAEAETDVASAPALDEPVAAVETAPVEPVEVAEKVEAPDAEKPSALVDPFKSILAAYYAESIAEGVTPQPELKAEIEATPHVQAASPADSAAPVDEPAEFETETPAADIPVAADLETPAAEEPLDTPSDATEEAVEEPAAAAIEEPEPHTPGRHQIPAAATGAAASVLAAYYADAPAEPASPATFETAAEFTPPGEATAVLPAVTAEVVRDDLPQSPVNPLGAGPQSANWGAEALAAAGSTEPTVPVGAAQEASAAEVVARLRAARDADAPTATAEAPAPAERKNGRRTFLMLAPVAAIAAIAVLLILLWNGHKDTPKAAPQTPSSTPTIILTGGPLKQSQEAYASALTRFTSASDAGGAVVAGGAAHDTLKLLKDFKGATGQDKTLLAAERAHLTSLYNLSTASPGGFAGAAGQAKSTLTAVQKAAGADSKAKAPNSGPATTQAINLLGAGNVTKLQQSINSLVAQADAASLTYQLRAVGSSAAGNSDAASSLASVVTGSSQATASTLASQFSALAPLVRITGDTLSDWSNIRPGVSSALGANPTAHIDSLIANAKQKLATWQAQQGNNANTQAINAYANAMRSHFGAFSSALSQIPSLNSGETCSAGQKDGTQSRAGNASYAVNHAAFGGSPPAALVAAHNALVNAINAGTAAATAAQNVTVLCKTTYGATSNWGTYTSNIWVKGGWGGKVGAWEAAVASALQQASASGTKPVV